ncbi:flagellar protein FliS [Cytobacillus eiseniae]|uniref:Flagellar protein FliS n=1 Tax=Cytobacillus eiseniae TaxID=762947 RepID=A0ABS4RI22_9BACI|nr:flagellar protein FliS [Cytobacillus eiseniae]MBP2241995.1 flagellar protein FliS [Cytobacillus eiseniae]
MKNYRKALHLYNQTKIISAPLEEIMITFIDKAISLIKLGRDAIDTKDLVVQNQSLQVAQECVLQLITFVIIEEKQGEELIIIYDYLNRQLIKANLEGDQKILDEVSNILLEQKDDWEIAMRSRRNKYRRNFI